MAMVLQKTNLVFSLGVFLFVIYRSNFLSDENNQQAKIVWRCKYVKTGIMNLLSLTDD
jgi:hypothetical protein